MAKILLVEDDNNLREVYEDRLLAEGYDIVSARDGEEALTVAMKERPDLIISDVMMPKISGFDMLDIIRSTEETKDVKVIMMTALSQAEDRDRATKLCADRYLVKSQVTLEDVAKAARDVLAGIELPAQDPVATATAAATPAPAEPTQVPVAPVAPVTPVVAPAPDPTPQPATTPAPVADDTATTAATPVPAVSVDTPEPALAEPTTDDEPKAPVSNPALDAITPNSTVEEESAVESSNPDSMAEEQTAIAKQIESFIDSKNSTTPEPPVNPDAVAEPTIVTDQQPPSVGKKVIQPISDAESKPDLDSLLKKEELKEEIAQVVQKVTTENSDKADEVIAHSVLKKASIENAQTPPAEPNPEDLQIGSDGQLSGVSVTPAEEPETEIAKTPEVQPLNQGVITPTEQVIPHTNGSSIDGVSSPQPGVAQPTSQSTDTTKPAVDPNSIAL